MMRIAQLASLVESVPPKKYGGIERFVHYLTEELVKRGHYVTLFASGDSQTKAKLVSIAKQNLRETDTPDPENNNMKNVEKVYDQANTFDIIHNNLDYYSFQAASKSKTPTVTTLHGPITKSNKNIYNKYKDLNFVSISLAQRKNGENLNWKANIYHGIPVEEFPFNNKPKDYLLVVGRITHEKGTHIAIDVANALKKELYIVAKLDKADVDYFREFIVPRLKSKNIHWVGEMGFEEKNKMMANALCMLHPVTWPEPFGLVLTEAMATGCPVVAFNLGSIPEIISDKKTGFIVKNEEEMKTSIKNMGSISRKACRKHVQDKFSLKHMVDGYEKLYDEIVYGGKDTPNRH
jgi:glycosyltransferase involved in cell wall biosynthesis